MCVILGQIILRHHGELLTNSRFEKYVNNIKQVNYYVVKRRLRSGPRSPDRKLKLAVAPLGAVVQALRGHDA